MKQQADSLSFRPSNEQGLGLEQSRISVVDEAVSWLLQFELPNTVSAIEVGAPSSTNESPQTDASTAITDAWALVEAAY